jgi:hypothetical protein
LVLFPLVAGHLVPLFPQVDSEELAEGQYPVEFFNYEGPQNRIETRAQIRGIGFTLGQAIRAGSERAGTADRYFVIHSVSESEGDKLDADIMGLGSNVGVDHIRNLRLIIQGYLEGAYAYGEQDAALLAQYITIYNAVFRPNWDFWNSRYKTPVLSNLTPDKAGLSTRYDQWPGQALIVIPLQTAVAGSLSAIDTGTLTEREVIDEMRKADDRGIPERREMVDIKEREADQAEQKAADQRREAAEEEQAIAQDRQQIEEDRQQLAQDRQQIAEDRRQVREDRDAGRISEEEAKEAEEELAARQAETGEKEEELTQREEDVAQREEALEETREEAQKSEEFAEQKLAEAQEERQEIAQDQQALIDQEAVQKPTGILGMSLLSPGSGLGRLLLVDPNSAEVLRSSAMTTINARTLTIIDGKILAVAGEDRGNSAIRLVEINPGSLEMVLQGDDDIHPQSLLWVNGSDIYAITTSAEGIFLGRYNTDLVRQARSNIGVHPFATVTFQEDVIVTQNTEGQAVVLNAQDLTQRK